MKTTLTKAQISENLVNTCGFEHSTALSIVNDFYAEIISALENGFDVRLSGFGNFILRDKSPRPARNPKTGEDATVSARRVVTFRTGVKMKDYVQSQREFAQKQ
jgi:integration host factor subunit alpha